jgi:hypothetical protein
LEVLYQGEKPMENEHSNENRKEIPTVVTAKYGGDERAVAAQASRKIPDNPEEVIAKNVKATCGCQCKGCHQ